MRSISFFPKAVGVLGIAVVAASASASERTSDVPAWLRVHVGEAEGQIAPLVLNRARALYQRKVAEGVVKNPCYTAMDATRPAELGGGRSGRRFFVICEAARSFRAISAGHGGGRNLRGIADFANGRRCVKHFGNALDSRLTTGGAYVTRETKTSFKGYYRTAPKQYAVLSRSFIQFDGEGETANARQREIGGHAAVLLRGVCLRKDTASPYANGEGYVPLGTLVDYSGGRSEGCTSWSASDARELVPMLKDNPTTLYIYPAAADVEAVAQAVAAGRSPSSAGLYWNASCLKDIGAPKFWRREALEPVIARYKSSLPPRAPQPLPICKER